MRTVGGVVAFLVAAAAALPASSVAAPGGATYLVTSQVDDPGAPSSDLTLRAAMEAASEDGTDSRIVLAIDGTYVLDRCTDGVDALLLTADGETVVEGRGATVEQTCAGERVLEVGGEGTLRLHDLTITGGDSRTAGGGVAVDGPQRVVVRGGAFVGNRSASEGGGLAVIGAGATIEHSSFEGNEARRGGGAWVNGDVVVSASTFATNVAATDGGALYAGRDVTARRSTFSGNTARRGSGAAIDARYAQLEHVTAAEDEAGPGGAVVRTRSLGLRAGASIVAAAAGADCALAQPGFSLGHNRSTTPTCGFDHASDDPGWEPALAPLGSYGGPLRTHLPLPTGDTVVDVIPATDPVLCGGGDVVRHDQRQVALPQGDGCDVGAVETPDPFPDVGPANPFYADIAEMDAVGLSSGFGDGTYRPDETVTRGAMAAFLHRVAGSPPLAAPDAPGPFLDVAADHPFAREIAWAADQDVTTGFADGTFRPGEAVTRQAMAAFLHRAEQAGGDLPSMATFSDVALDHPFALEVEWMAATGLSTGFADGTWRPDEQVTRQAVARYLVQLHAG